MKFDAHNATTKLEGIIGGGPGRGIFERRKVALALRKMYTMYGTCKRCGTPWSHCEGHTTQINNAQGVFPLCEDCWSELETPEARLPYYAMLWMEWEAQDANGTLDPLIWEDIKIAVAAGK
jgi:hypothetical protein